MKKIGIFYGTTSGVTSGIVDEIEFYLKGMDYETFNVENGIEQLKTFDNLILVTPTYGVGELQSDWENVFEEFKKIDFSNKNIGIVGVGNQLSFGESFVGAMRILYDAVIKQNGNIIGFTEDKGYRYTETTSVVNEKFVGLALDESNQGNVTPDKIKAWIEEIKSLFY